MLEVAVEVGGFVVSGCDIAVEFLFNVREGVAEVAFAGFVVDGGEGVEDVG